MKKLTMLLIIFVLAIPFVSNATSKNLEVHFIDVGQGDSILLKTPDNQNVIIDAGNKGKGDEVVAYLKSKGIKTLDAVISTHPDADHVGGLDEVINAFNVKSVYAPKVTHTTQAFKDFLLAVKNKKLTIKEAKSGVNLPLKGVTATFVAPVKTYAKDLNNWSAVLKLTYKQNSFLFTGDAEFKSEEDMLASKQDLSADVLKVGHHGAHETTSTEFLAAVKPKYAVYSVSATNGYGHPTKENMDRVTTSGAKIFRTDKSGSIVISSNGTKITIKTER